MTKNEKFKPNFLETFLKDSHELKKDEILASNLTKTKAILIFMTVTVQRQYRNSDDTCSTMHYVLSCT